MTTRKITLTVDVDANGAIRDIRGVSNAANQASDGMDKASRSSRTLTQRFDKLGREASQVAGRVGAVLGTAIAGAGIAAIKLGIDAEETAAKFDTVFRGSVDETRKALDGLAVSSILTSEQLESSASSVQDLLVPLGLAREEAAGLSVEAVSLAGDLASFNNVDTQTVIEGIQSALAGSSEPLRRYGIDVRETRLQTLAYERGLVDLGGELTQAERAQAVFLAITADSSDAIGDLARTSGSTANQFRQLSRDFRQSGEDLGVALLPAINDLLTNLRGTKDEVGPLTDLIGDLTSGMFRLAEIGLTAAGAFEELGLRIGGVLAVGDRLVNASRDNFGISSIIVPFKGLVDAAQALNQTIDDSPAVLDAMSEDIDRLRQETGDLVSPLIAARLEFDRNRKGGKDLEDQLEDTGDEVETLAGTVGESTDELNKNSDAADEARESLFNFKDEVGRLRAELAGESSVAIFEYNQQIQEYRDLLTAGAISQSEFNDLVEVTAQLFARDQVEAFRKSTEEFREYGVQLSRLAFDLLPPFIQQIQSVRDLLGIDGDGGGGADNPTFFDNLAETLGGSIAGSLQNGQSLGDSIGTSLVQFGSEGIADAVTEVFSAAFDGLEDNPELQDTLRGFSIVVGEAIRGNTEQAIGSAAGAIIGSFIPGVGTALGAAIGGALGSLFGGESTPKFQIAGLGANGQDLGNRELLETAIGDFSVAFRDIEDEAAREVENLLVEFGQSIAGTVRDSDALDIIQNAIRDVSFSSRSDGESAEAIIEAVFTEIVESLETGVRQFVERGRSQAEQLDRFATLFTINRNLAVGFGLGLGGGAGSIFGAGGALVPGNGGGGSPSPITPPGFTAPEGGSAQGGTVQTIVGAFAEFESGSNNISDALLRTVEIIEENRLGNESLLETYSRLVQGLDGLDQAARLTGNAIAQTREQAVGFTSELLAFFGDDAAALNASLGTIFDTFFTQEQNALQAIESANERATDLLARIGIDATEEILSQEGFGNLFSELFGTLDPESTAILINAGNEIARLIAAEGDLAAVRGEAIASELDLQQIRRETAAIVNPTRAAFDDLFDSIRENSAAAGQLADVEKGLTAVRENAIARLGVFLFDATESLIENTISILERDQQVATQQIQNIQRIGQASENRYREELSALDAISDLVDDLRIGSLSPLSPLGREDEARRQLEELFASAEGGDIDALQDLPAAVQAFLQLLQNNTGGVGRFPAEFEAVLARLEAIEDAGPSTRPPTAVDIQQIQQTNEVGFQTVDDNLSELRASLELLREEQQNLALLDQFRAIAGALNESPSELAARLGVPLDDLILAITGELPDLTGEALEGFFDDLVASTEGTNSELQALESIGIETNQILEDVRDILADISTRPASLPEEGDQQAGPAPTPPPFADGGFASGIVRTGERGPELILPNDVSRFFQRNGIPVNSGGDNQQTVELLSRILAATERNGGGQSNLADALSNVASEIRISANKTEREQIVGEMARGGGNCGRF